MPYDYSGCDDVRFSRSIVANVFTWLLFVTAKPCKSFTLAASLRTSLAPPHPMHALLFSRRRVDQDVLTVPTREDYGRLGFLSRFCRKRPYSATECRRQARSAGQECQRR